MYPVHSRPSTLTILPPPSSTTATQHSQPNSHFFPLTTQNNTPTFTTALLATPSTPIALTPNTMKTIEQSILQTLGEDTEESYMMESQQYSGNFVPPLPSSTSTITLINTWQGGQVSSDGVGNAAAPGGDDDDDTDMKPEVPMKQEMMDDEKSACVPEVNNSNNNKKRKPARKSAAAAQQPQKGNQQPKQAKKAGTRAPGKKGRTPEEDERRKIRRERNKLAAARCRKRRVDHTNKLIEETEGLEAKKRALQNQITDLQSVKVDLEFLLENHPCVKSNNKIRSEVLADLQNLPRSIMTSSSSSTTSSPSSNSNHFIGVKPKRPNTLNVAAGVSTSGCNSIDSNGRGLINVTTPAPPITISTPSNGIAGLGFEPLCSDWGVASVSTPSSDAIVSEKGTAGSTGNVSTFASSSNHNSNKGSSLVTPVNPFKKLQDL